MLPRASVAHGYIVFVEKKVGEWFLVFVTYTVLTPWFRLYS